MSCLWCSKTHCAGRCVRCAGLCAATHSLDAVRECERRLRVRTARGPSTVTLTVMCAITMWGTLDQMCKAILKRRPERNKFWKRKKR